MQSTEFTREENISFWKNMFLVAVFFLVTPVTLGISLFSLFSLRSSELVKTSLTQSVPTNSGFSGVQVFAALPPALPSISGEVGSNDARPEIIRQYLYYYNSPLIPYADLIVQTADKYSLDYRLITAIAQQESNLCKITPPNSYNCWGWGINSASNLSFNSYQEGIEQVSKGLKTAYVDKGYTTVTEIMGKYNPVSPGGAEGKSIIGIMDTMQ